MLLSQFEAIAIALFKTLDLDERITFECASRTETDGTTTCLLRLKSYDPATKDRNGLQVAYADTFLSREGIMGTHQCMEEMILAFEATVTQEGVRWM